MNKRDQNKFSQSLVDFLMNVPGFQEDFHKDNFVRAKPASRLFSIWKDISNKISEDVYRKPFNVASADVEDLVKEGLVKHIGDRLHITAKGTEVIKILILGDDRSVFEDNGKDISIEAAQDSIDKVAKKRAEKQWWRRYLENK